MEIAGLKSTNKKKQTKSIQQKSHEISTGTVKSQPASGFESKKKMPSNSKLLFSKTKSPFTAYCDKK